MGHIYSNSPTYIITHGHLLQTRPIVTIMSLLYYSHNLVLCLCDYYVTAAVVIMSHDFNYCTNYII